MKRKVNPSSAPAVRLVEADNTVDSAALALDGADRGSVRNALTSASFIEKVAVLLLTAGLTGLLAPWIINHLNSREAERQRELEVSRAEQQKELEARKARDASILQSQSKLLDDAAETIISYEMLALDVSWYKDPLGGNEELHRKAFERYSERVVDLFTRWQTLISRSRTLASPAVSGKLEAFLKRIYNEQDTPIGVLVKKNATGAEWTAMHVKSEEMLHDADALITELAKDMRLSRDDLHR